MSKPKLKITLDKTESGQGCSWLTLSIEDTANSKSRTRRDAQGVPYVNLEAFYGVSAVKLDDGRVSVFRIYRNGCQELRRDSALRRQIAAEVKAFLA